MSDSFNMCGIRVRYDLASFACSMLGLAAAVTAWAGSECASDSVDHRIHQLFHESPLQFVEEPLCAVLQERAVQYVAFGAANVLGAASLALGIP